jgi:hypothetical protein
MTTPLFPHSVLENKSVTIKKKPNHLPQNPKNNVCWWWLSETVLKICYGCEELFHYVGN